jgi:hypothetical protein
MGTATKCCEGGNKIVFFYRRLACVDSATRRLPATKLEKRDICNTHCRWFRPESLNDFLPVRRMQYEYGL